MFPRPWVLVILIQSLLRVAQAVPPTIELESFKNEVINDALNIIKDQPGLQASAKHFAEQAPASELEVVRLGRTISPNEFIGIWLERRHSHGQDDVSLRYLTSIQILFIIYHFEVVARGSHVEALKLLLRSRFNTLNGAKISFAATHIPRLIELLFDQALLQAKGSPRADALFAAHYMTTEARYFDGSSQSNIPDTVLGIIDAVKSPDGYEALEKAIRSRTDVDASINAAVMDLLGEHKRQTTSEIRDPYTTISTSPFPRDVGTALIALSKLRETRKRLQSALDCGRAQFRPTNDHQFYINLLNIPGNRPRTEFAPEDASILVNFILGTQNWGDGDLTLLVELFLTEGLSPETINSVKSAIFRKIYTNLSLRNSLAAQPETIRTIHLELLNILRSVESSHVCAVYVTEMYPDSDSQRALAQDLAFYGR